jgi:predicted O-methyltransferase YrrM
LWSDIPGFCDFEALYTHAAARLPERGAVAVEVGCWLGRSVAFLASEMKRLGKGQAVVYAIDHGFGTPTGSDANTLRPVVDLAGGNIAGHLVSNLDHCGLYPFVRPLILPSIVAAELFADGTVDFIFIDANHNEAAVLADLEAWFPKLKPNGLIAGHDYVRDPYSSVVKAVNAFFGSDDCSDPICPHCWSVRA